MCVWREEVKRKICEVIDLENNNMYREYLREILVYFGLVIIKRKTMKFIQILAALLLFNFITISSYAKNIAPEVTLKEEDFAYNQYKVELED